MVVYVLAIGIGIVVLALSAVVVGAVVIGFGTSAPELLVSGIAAAEGSADVGVGNIIGSDVANLTLVLGIAALVGSGMTVSTSTLRREVPLGLGATLLFAWFVHDGLTRPEGGVLLLLMTVTVVFLIRTGRRSPDPAQQEAGEEVAEIVTSSKAAALGRS